ncbi:MAG: hypothetical protein FWH22_07660 [Fibromonadales bacterium]|nr:hypothetical protein [Fibromonadales bacterium]
MNKIKSFINTRARHALPLQNLAKILFVLIIGIIGVKTFTSCSSGGGGGGGGDEAGWQAAAATAFRNADFVPALEDIAPAVVALPGGSGSLNKSSVGAARTLKMSTEAKKTQAERRVALAKSSTVLNRMASVAHAIPVSAIPSSAEVEWLIEFYENLLSVSETIKDVVLTDFEGSDIEEQNEWFDVSDDIRIKYETNAAGRIIFYQAPRATIKLSMLAGGTNEVYAKLNDYQYYLEAFDEYYPITVDLSMSYKGSKFISVSIDDASYDYFEFEEVGGVKKCVNASTYVSLDSDYRSFYASAFEENATGADMWGFESGADDGEYSYSFENGHFYVVEPTYSFTSSYTSNEHVVVEDVRLDIGAFNIVSVEVDELLDEGWMDAATITLADGSKIPGQINDDSGRYKLGMYQYPDEWWQGLYWHQFWFSVTEGATKFSDLLASYDNGLALKPGVEDYNFDTYRQKAQAAHDDFNLIFDTFSHLTIRLAALDDFSDAMVDFVASKGTGF